MTQQRVYMMMTLMKTIRVMIMPVMMMFVLTSSDTDHLTTNVKWYYVVQKCYR